MKTTLDLPDELVREIKVRAAQQGRKIKDLVAELLRHAIADDRSGTEIRHRVSFPLLPPIDAENITFTPNDVSEALIAQEAEWFRES